MINFNFPEGYIFYRLVGVIAFPEGFWSVALIRYPRQDGEPPRITTKSVLIWPKGRIEEVDVKFEMRGDDLVGGKNFIQCSENLDSLKDLGIDFNKYGLVGKGHVWGELRGIAIEEFRSVSGSSSQSVREPEGSNCLSSPIDFETLKIANKNLKNMILGFFPEKPGIGFQRGKGSPVFINPDDSKEWLCSCMSVDELTCLAVHKTGCCVIDNPV